PHGLGVGAGLPRLALHGRGLGIAWRDHRPARGVAVSAGATPTAALRSAIEWRMQRPTSGEVSNHARLVFLDTVGCALAGRVAPEVAALERNLSALEPGPFHFPGAPGLGLRAATQVLAIATTWHEACEGHAYAHGRPGIPVIAALLPLGVQRGCTLGKFIDALVVGYEAGARAGGWLRVAPGQHVDG